MKIRGKLILVACILGFGCTTSNVIPTGPDTFMITSSGVGFSTAEVRENVFYAANEYCANRGLVMVPVSFKATPGEYGRHPPSADLIFRALKSGDPDIGKVSLTEANQIKVEQDIRMRTQSEPSTETDIYAEILKLDDLRKKGLITDAEFDREKAKLLSGDRKLGRMR